MARTGEILNNVHRKRRKDLVALSSRTDKIDRGLGWDIFYRFELLSGESGTLLLETGDIDIHANDRTVRAIDLENKIVNVRVTTITDFDVVETGNDISEKIVNSNFNFNDDIQLSFYDETSEISVNGMQKTPFSGTLKADRRLTESQFIEREYVLENNGYLAIQFENQGDGDVEIEYSASGYQIHGGDI